MADLGFLPGVTRILAATPAGGQRLLFSATLDNGVDKLVKRFLRNEVTHSVDEANVAGAGDDPPRLPRGRRRRQERSWCTGSHRAAAAGSCSCAPSIRPASSPSQLTEAGIPSVDLHGNLSQPARDRNLAAFSSGEPHACWSPPTSPPAVSTSTTSNWSSTSTRRPSTRPTCTARDAPRAPATRGDVVTVVLPEQRKRPRAADAQGRHQRSPAAGHRRLPARRRPDR